MDHLLLQDQYTARAHKTPNKQTKKKKKKKKKKKLAGKQTRPHIQASETV
jgi:hypothetical protein